QRQRHQRDPQTGPSQHDAPPSTRPRVHGGVSGVPGRGRVKRLPAAGRHVTCSGSVWTPTGQTGRMRPGRPPRWRRATRPRSRAARNDFPDRVTMAWLLVLDLIRFFEFYLALIFVVGIVLRVRQYLTVVAIVRRLPGRWPRLLQLMATKHGIFLNGRTVWP